MASIQESGQSAAKQGAVPSIGFHAFVDSDNQFSETTVLLRQLEEARGNLDSQLLSLLRVAKNWYEKHIPAYSEITKEDKEAFRKTGFYYGFDPLAYCFLHRAANGEEHTLAVNLNGEQGGLTVTIYRGNPQTGKELENNLLGGVGFGFSPYDQLDSIADFVMGGDYYVKVITKPNHYPIRDPYQSRSMSLPPDEIGRVEALKNVSCSYAYSRGALAINLQGEPTGKVDPFVVGRKVLDMLSNSHPVAFIVRRGDHWYPKDRLNEWKVQPLTHEGVSNLPPSYLPK